MGTIKKVETSQNVSSKEYKFFRALTLTIATLSILSQFYSLVLQKAFWLDEWFILYNLKFRTFSESFGPLFYIQQFPRTYLVFLKLITKYFNYDYFAIRFIPTFIQLLNLALIYFVVSKNIYSRIRIKRYIFFLLFLSYHSTLFYFTQIKQYSMEIFFVILCFVCFDYLITKLARTERVRWKNAFVFVVFLTGPLMSYSFPIVAAPALFLVTLKTLTSSDKLKLKKTGILVGISFFIGLTLSWFTDLRFVLSDKQQYGNFSSNVFDYSSANSLWEGVKNIVWLPSSIFFFNKNYPLYIVSIFYVFKIIVLLVVLLGVFLNIKNLYPIWKFSVIHKKSKLTNLQWLESYLFLILCATLFLYILKLLPLGVHRLNYFCVLPLSYFLIKGTFAIVDRRGYQYKLMLWVTIFVASFPAVRSSLNELANDNLNFSQEIYNNVGNAIEVAEELNLPITVIENEFFPHSIMSKSEILMIKSHHLYKPGKSPEVFILKQFNRAGKPSLLVKKESFAILPKEMF